LCACVDATLRIDLSCRSFVDVVVFVVVTVDVVVFVVVTVDVVVFVVVTVDVVASFSLDDIAAPDNPRCGSFAASLSRTISNTNACLSKHDLNSRNLYTNRTPA